MTTTPRLRRLPTLRPALPGLAAAALAALLLAGCASPQARLQAGLQGAGLPPRLSACMADYMVHRLSLVQLRRLSALGSLKDADLGAMSVDRFMRKIRALQDPEIVSVAVRGAAVCALSG